MDFDQTIGYLLIGLGIYSLIGRFIWPHHFAKVQAMKDKWGAKRGLALHVFAYTVLPIVCGTLMVFK
jgi:hypothetical protein